MPFVGGGVGDDDTGDAGAGYFVVLGDLGERYRDNRLVRPSAGHARALGEALARLHAHRWHDADETREPSVLLAAFERHLAHVRAGLEPIASSLGDGLTSERRAWLEDAFGRGGSGRHAPALGGAARAGVAGDAESLRALANERRENLG